jgi:hypothetical protein
MPLSLDTLLERQKLESRGGELREDLVVVAAQPFELGLEAAKHVRINIDCNIGYVYFFEANLVAADKVARLLQMVLLANNPQLTDDQDFRTRNELVVTNGGQIIADLQHICVNHLLQFYFLGEPLDLQYCIHNASSIVAARVYAKYPTKDEFVEWESGEQAYRFWDDVRQKNGAYNPQPPGAVFHGGRGFELKEGPFLMELRSAMHLYFFEISDEVMKLCLEGAPPSGKQRRGRHRSTRS